MSEKILVPVLGESITEATVAKWLKKKGESVNADEPIIELETDKVNLEVPSPITGVITEINCNNGDTVAVGAVLGTVTDGTKETEKIEKKEKKSSEQNQSNNIINLEQEKNQEPRFFQDKNNISQKTSKRGPKTNPVGTRTFGGRQRANLYFHICNAL